MNCGNCGNPIEEGATSCSLCGQTVTQEEAALQTQIPVAAPKSENVLTGTVGALIGATIGAAVILLLGQLGYVASISGLVLAVCTLKGYELLGHKLSTKGILICLVLIMITPYFADRLDWAMWICRELDDDSISVGQVYASIPDLLAEGYLVKSEYIKGLVMLYVFAALGALGTVRDLFKK